MKVVIFVTTQFEGFHRWKDAPDDVSFLRNYHRHIFEVEMGMEVGHLNRDIEFFQLKKELDEYVDNYFARQSFEYSCELIAGRLLNQFDAQYVKVSEDGENGAIVTKVVAI